MLNVGFHFSWSNVFLHDSSGPGGSAFGKPAIVLHIITEKDSLFCLVSKSTWRIASWLTSALRRMYFTLSNAWRRVGTPKILCRWAATEKTSRTTNLNVPVESWSISWIFPVIGASAGCSDSCQLWLETWNKGGKGSPREENLQIPRTRPYMHPEIGQQCAFLYSTTMVHPLLLSGHLLY